LPELQQTGRYFLWFCCYSDNNGRKSAVIDSILSTTALYWNFFLFCYM